MKCIIKKSWIKAELKEHGPLFVKSRRLGMSRKIVKGHIKELGCGYYPSLFKMERKLRRR